MTIGTYFAEGRKRQGYSQQRLSDEVAYARETISKYENGERTIPKEAYAPLVKTIDDPELYFHVWSEKSDFVSIPYFDGDYINHQSLNILHLVKKETEEAFDHLKHISWEKPAEVLSDYEREEAKQAMIEILDAAASMVNLVAALCREYKFSMKEVFRAWHVSLKSRRYKK
ncbi:helix-turn-helix transcriptional regulator [Metabacillus fastidiosus]|uniref:helix-turn-helix domain-containing protein n=1 Tax=Metabacillus fastidiosus TaxID=1458 RepID=UPI003D2C6D72